MRNINKQTVPKPSQNPPKIDKKLKKSSKIVEKVQDGLRCVQKCEKKAKQPEKVRKIGPRPPQEEGHQNDDALRVPSSRGGEAPPKGGTMRALCEERLTRVGCRTPAHCDASRISAGVRLENLSQQGLISPNSARIWPQPIQKVLNPPKSLPKPSQNGPKLTPNRSRWPLGVYLGPMLY